LSRALPAGHSIHEYRIQSVLGMGGFGITYLAEDGNLNTKVALKEYLPNDLALRQDDYTVTPKSDATEGSFQHGLTRFMEEARTLASFRHTSIVRVWRFFEANQTGYMVMEFVDGRPLHEWITLYRPLSREMFLSIVDRLLDGLDVIHRAGYLHRDIKPNNIFMREDGSPVLIDFGSARRSHGDGEMTAMVSAGYAPLEQYHSDGKQGAWSDLYALGGVLYWLVTAVKPVEAVARVRQDNLVPAEKIGDANRYGINVLRAIDWALKMNETERPQSVREFRAALGLSTSGVERTLRITETAGRAIAEGPISTGLTGVALDLVEVKQTEAELAGHIGPIASVVVRRAAKKAASIRSLIETVAAEIPDENKRAAFVKKLLSATTSRPITPSPTSSAAPNFSAETLVRAEKALAYYIGAIAKVIVKRAAAKARDESELYSLIAEEIESPSDRQAFIRQARSTPERK
jgi:serine/threonine protein kinase